MQKLSKLLQNVAGFLFMKLGNPVLKIVSACLLQIAPYFSTKQSEVILRYSTLR